MSSAACWSSLGNATRSSRSFRISSSWARSFSSLSLILGGRSLSDGKGSWFSFFGLVRVSSTSRATASTEAKPSNPNIFSISLESLQRLIKWGLCRSRARSKRACSCESSHHSGKKCRNKRTKPRNHRSDAPSSPPASAMAPTMAPL